MRPRATAPGVYEHERSRAPAHIHRRSLEPRRRSNGLATALPTPIDHRTKTEQTATILLPNPVAASDRQRHVMDGRTKILKEYKTVQNEPSLAETAVTEFRVRCFSRSATPSQDRECMSVALQYLAAAQAIEEPNPPCQRDSGGALRTAEESGWTFRPWPLVFRHTTPSRAPEIRPRTTLRSHKASRICRLPQVMEVGFCRPCRACDYC